VHALNGAERERMELGQTWLVPKGVAGTDVVEEVVQIARRVVHGEEPA